MELPASVKKKVWPFVCFCFCCCWTGYRELIELGTLKARQGHSLKRKRKITATLKLVKMTAFRGNKKMAPTGFYNDKILTGIGQKLPTAAIIELLFFFSLMAVDVIVRFTTQRFDLFHVWNTCKSSLSKKGLTSNCNASRCRPAFWLLQVFYFINKEREKKLIERSRRRGGKVRRSGRGLIYFRASAFEFGIFQFVLYR